MTHNPMRSVCLGVDPGIANTGLAIVVRTPSDYKLVALRCVTSRADEPEAQRLRKIYDAVDALLVRTHHRRRSDRTCVSQQERFK